MTSALDQPNRLEDLLNYRLMRLFALSGAPVLRLLEGQFGISRREWGLLGLLAARGSVTPSELAQLMQLDRPRVSRALTRLAGKQLVRRVARAGDRRWLQVSLTPQGQALHDVIFPQVAAINRQVVEVLDADTLAALDCALSLLTLQAQRLNGELVQDVRADRRGGVSRREGLWDVDPA